MRYRQLQLSTFRPRPDPGQSAARNKKLPVKVFTAVFILKLKHQFRPGGRSGGCQLAPCAFLQRRRKNLMV